MTDLVIMFDKICTLYFVDNLNQCDTAFLKLTNMACSAFPFWGAVTHIGVPQIFAGATITASTPITVTVLQVTCFSLPSITTCTQEISYTVCTAAIVPTWVGGTFVFICGFRHKQFCCDTKSLNHWYLLWGGINVYKYTKYFITPHLYWTLCCLRDISWCYSRWMCSNFEMTECHYACSSFIAFICSI